MISARTKAALAAAKARGVKLGGRRPKHKNVDGQLSTSALEQAADEFAHCVGPVIAELRSAGLSFRQIVADLDRRCIRTVRGGAWAATTVWNVLQRVAA